jgi:hypothetical protein
MEFIQKFIDSRNRKAVLHRDGIEGMIVHTKPPSTILLTDQKHRRGERASARTDNTIGQHISDHSGHNIFLVLRIAIRSDVDWFGVGKEVDMVVLGTMRGKCLGFGENLRIFVGGWGQYLGVGLVVREEVFEVRVLQP